MAKVKWRDGIDAELLAKNVEAVGGKKMCDALETVMGEVIPTLKSSAEDHPDQIIGSEFVRKEVIVSKVIRLLNDDDVLISTVKKSLNQFIHINKNYLVSAIGSTGAEDRVPVLTTVVLMEAITEKKSVKNGLDDIMDQVISAMKDYSSGDSMMCGKPFPVPAGGYMSKHKSFTSMDDMIKYLEKNGIMK